MDRHPRFHQRGHQQRRTLALWCLLVLGVVLGHHALMLTARHIVVMAPQHGIATDGAATVLDAADDAMAHDHRPAPHDQHSLLGDCPAVQALLPGLLALPLLASILIALLATYLPGLRADARGLPAPFHPPPRPPSERRARLQVFLI